MNTRPPVFAGALLLLIPRPHRDTIAGDIDEEYADWICHERGRLGAAVWYWSQAVRSLGSYLRWRSRSEGIRRYLPPVLRETRQAARSLRRSPGFAALAILTLAVGIGSTASVFSVARWLLFRPIPGVVNPEQLVSVSFQDREGTPTGVSIPDVEDFRAGARTLNGIAAVTTIATLQVSTRVEGPQTVAGDAVTGGYFQVLGVHAVRGRLLTRNDAEASGAQPVAVISYDLWVSAFHADSATVGREMRIDGLPFSIIGIAPKGFGGPWRLGKVRLWFGATQYAAIRHATKRLDPQRRSSKFLTRTIARLRPGATPAEAQRELRAVAARMSASYPEDDGVFQKDRPAVSSGVGVDGATRAYLVRSLRMLFGMVGLILLIACANVANLVVLRGMRRRGETAMRQALGASHAHILLQRLVEGLLLSLPAGFVGVLLAVGLNQILWNSGFLLAAGPGRVPLDRDALFFAFALCVATAVFFGIIPALNSGHAGVAEEIRTSQRTASTRRPLLQRGLVVAQLSLSLALIVTALLLGQTLVNLRGVQIGFRPAGVFELQVDPGPQGYGPDETHRLHRRVLEAVGQIPGVREVSASSAPPFSGIQTPVRISLPGGTATVKATAESVAEGYFGVLHIPLREGRGLLRNEAVPGAQGDVAVVVSRRLAGRLFGAQAAVGRSIMLETPSGQTRLVIVGVAGDVRDSSPREKPEARIYLPLQMSRSAVTLLVRSSESPDRLEAAVRGALATVDPNVPLGYAASMESEVGRSMADERTLARLVALLAALAIGLGGVGLYSIVAYGVTARKREFGVRVALGSTRRGIILVVLRETLRLGALGCAIGLVATEFATRLVRTVLFGMGAMDGVAMGLGVVVLLLVTILAGMGPALHAAAVDPAGNLRAE